MANKRNPYNISGYVFPWKKGDKNPERMWKKAQPFYKEMLSWGINPVAALGILGNMALESSFDPNAASPGGTYTGYVQNSRDIAKYIKDNYGYDHKGQMNYIRDGLAGKLKGTSPLRQQLQARFNNYTKGVKGVVDPRLAANMWDDWYEISNPAAKNMRMGYAQYFFNQLFPNGYNPMQQAMQTLPISDKEYIENKPQFVGSTTYPEELAPEGFVPPPAAPITLQELNYRSPNIPLEENPYAIKNDPLKGYQIFI